MRGKNPRAKGFWRHKVLWALAVASMNCVAPLDLRSSALKIRAETNTDANTTHDGERIRAFEVEVEQLRDFLRIPGFSVAIVRGKHVLWAKGFGYRDYEKRLPAAPDTLYPIASLTKTFSSVLLMQMVERRLLDLGDPVTRYRTDQDVATTTRIKHYLTHTSEDIPGEYFYYSGGRFGRLTTVLEKATGKSFKALVAESIFKRVGMERSVPGLNAEGYDKVLGALAQPYVLSKGQITKSEYPSPGMSAATGAVSTVLDLAKYDLAIRENILLRKQSKEQMFTPITSNGGRVLPYGLGWFVQEYEGHKLIWAYGQETTFSSLYLKIPDLDITLIVLGNRIALSDPFWLILGNVRRSPLALAFLRTFILRKGNAATLLPPDWNLSAALLSAELSRLEARAGRYNYADELVAHAFAEQWLGNKSRSVELLKLAFERYPNLKEAGDGAMLAVLARSGDSGLQRTGEKIGRKLLNENPKHPRVLFDLGVLYLQSQREEQAMPLFEQIVANKNLSSKWLLAYSSFWLGKFYFDKDPMKAKGYLEFVITTRYDDGSLQQNTRELLDKLGSH